MAMYDLPLDQLRDRRSDLQEPADLDDFWRGTLAAAREHPLDLTVEPVETPLTVVESFDVSFAGAGGQPVRAWLHLPVHREGPLPCVVQYVGYGGGRGAVHENVRWACAGYAHLVMDTRGQGSGWSSGSTPDDVGSGPSHPGFLTRGVERPADLYHQRVYTDAVRLVDAVLELDHVDPARVAVGGRSQGGALALVAAALHPAVAAVLPDVPFLCDIRRATELTDSGPYAEITRYLAVHRSRREQVFHTLAYVDGVLMARRATAPALFSVALMDDICPPSCVFAAFNAYGGRADIEVYHYNGHEGGGPEHDLVQMAWLRERFHGG